MKNKTFLLPLITFLFLSNYQLMAQVHADFTANPSAGCSPLQVNFTNLSSGPGTLSYTWYLQPGISTLKDPQATYITPGTYNIKLVVTNGTQTDSVTKPVVVFRSPAADFTANQKGCVPHNVQFNDASTPGDAPISAWRWDFRSGSIDTRQNPTKLYSTAGKYDVFLEVTDNNGCKSSIDKLQFIDVANPPDAAFTFTPASACAVPALITFTNTSTGQGTITYNWNFGDNTSSTLKNPTKTYNQFGSYKVTLQVNSDYGCSDTLSKFVNINNIVAAGTLSQGGKLINNNDTICVGQVDFSSTSSGTSSVLWKFGDGKTSISKSGFHVYTQGGNITVLLIAAPGTSCADTVTWSFYMNQPTANFTLSSNYSCNSSALVNFTDNSTGAVAWEWTFNDGTKATTRNTSKTYSLPAETDPYIINTEVIFNTTLKVTSKYGCTHSISKPFTIKKPTAMFTVDKAQGCMPLTVKFKDQSQSDEPITTRQWIFGNGATSSGSIDSTSYTYTTDGTFLARLVITNNLGCRDTSFIIPVKVGKNLTPDFNISKSSVCPGEVIQFTDATSPSNLAQSWHYSVDGKSINNLPGVKNPYWKVDNVKPGSLDVKLQVNYNGCISERTKSGALTNNGALADFSYSFNCNTPFSYQFTNLSLESTSVEWNFGDGTPVSTANNPTHNFSSEGNYMVRLVAVKGSCYDTLIKEVKVRNVNAVITANASACGGVPVKLRGSNSYGMVDYCYEKYEWNFGDNTQIISTRIDTVMHTFAGRGTYPVKLKTHYDNGCIDSAVLNIRIYQPYVTFTPDTSYGCSPFTVHFTDNSTPDVNALQQWRWDFADGKDTTYTVKKTVIPHYFAIPGVFNVTLTVRDAMGCEGSYSRTISTANPNAEFLADKPLNCVGSELKFYYNYTTGDSVIWNFGDGTISRSKTIPISHTFATQGNKTVSLTIYKYGCSHTYSSPAGYIVIQKPDARYTVSDSVWNCYPKQITFTHHDPGKIVQSGTWEFGYNNNTSAYDTVRVFNYPRPGIYLTRLMIETTYGCRDTAEKSITITGPTGSFSITPSSKNACRGDEVTFHIKDTSNVWDFEWDMGDGWFVDGDPVKHVYTRMGTLYPKLILYGDNGLCIPPPVVDTLLIFEVIAEIGVPDTGLCEQYQIPFGNNSTGNTINNWSFSNGVTSAAEVPVVQFSPGNYTVQLMVFNDMGCSDTTTASFVINPIPPITVSADTFICQGDAITLYATGGDAIQWYPATGLSNARSYTPLASPQHTTNYTAVVSYLSTGCRNSDQLFLLVQEEPDITIHPYPDTTIIIGEIVHILSDSLFDVTYSWSPSNWLSCSNCASPFAQPLETTRYTLTVVDTNYCFTKYYDIDFEVIEEYSLDLPTAFTPNGDGINDVIYVKGWGIKKLLEFRIFNRWGNEVFFTDDINQGWDGTFKGKVQNIDSYAYIVTVEMWDGRIVTKKGAINLLR